MRQINPLVDILPFGARVSGTVASNPTPGTDYKHYVRIIYGLSSQIVKFGIKPHGTAGGVTPPVGPPPSDTVLTNHGPVGPWLSRKRFREIIEAERAQLEAERKAEDLQGRKQEALAAAAQVAAEAIEAVETTENEAALEALARLAVALDAATSAKRVSDILVNAAAAKRAALEALQEIDEDEAIALLLLNG